MTIKDAINILKNVDEDGVLNSIRIEKKNVSCFGHENVVIWTLTKITKKTFLLTCAEWFGDEKEWRTFSETVGEDGFTLSTF